MSRVTKLKKIKREIEADDLSLPTESQQIVKVISSKGNNLHEVETESESKFLVSMPNKFRKNVWIKRGNYVLINQIDEGDKVKGEIIRILTSEHEKEFKKHNLWPKKFTKKRDCDEMSCEEDDHANNMRSNLPAYNEDESSSSEEDIHENPNRRIDLKLDSESESD